MYEAPHHGRQSWEVGREGRHSMAWALASLCDQILTWKSEQSNKSQPEVGHLSCYEATFVKVEG